MAINTEKLYANACEALLFACRAYHDNERDGDALYKTITKDPDAFTKATYMPTVLPAIQIYAAAREEISKSKGGSTYTILKKFIKAIPEYRRDIAGTWMDSAGRQCLCDGFRAIRLNDPVDGLKAAETVTPFDLGKVYPTEVPPTHLELPTTGELKQYIADPGSPRLSDGTVVYDFGPELPRVNAKYLKDMVDVFPDAEAFCDGTKKPIAFISLKGDGLLLPIHKNTA